MKKLIILLLLLCNIAYCQIGNKQINVFSNSDTLKSNVWICGKITDQNRGNIVLLKNCNTLFSIKPVVTTTVSASGDFCFGFHLAKPEVLRLLGRPFYIAPNDSVFVNISGDRYMPSKLEFSGRSATSYIYAYEYFLLMRSMTFKYYSYDFKNGLNNYLDSLNHNKEIYMNHLNAFSEKYKISNDFKAYALFQINYDYYYELFYPFNVKKYPVDQVPISYSSIFNQIKLTDDNLFDKMEYFITASSLIDYKVRKNNSEKYHEINENATGLTKEYLLTEYANSLILSFESKDSLKVKGLFEKIDHEITYPDFRATFNALKDQLSKTLLPFPKDVLQTALMDSLGRKLNFGDLLAKYKDKVIVLDFWASWCGPCKEGMPKVNQLEKKLSSSEVRFVYLSLDKTENDWRTGLQQTKIPGNHYLVEGDFKSAIAKYLVIHSIPRYVIINQLGHLERTEASGPYSDNNGLILQIKSLLKTK